MHKLTGIIAIVLCIGSGAIAEANATYSFQLDASGTVNTLYNSGTNTYTFMATAGSTVTVNVYLYESLSLPSDTTYIAPVTGSLTGAPEGLQSAGVALNVSNNSAGATIGIQGSSAFNDFNPYLSSQLAPGQTVGVLSFQSIQFDSQGHAIIPTGALGTTVSGGTPGSPEVTAILVGSFTFALPSDASTYSHVMFSTSDLYASMADNLTFTTLTDLDALMGPGAYPNVDILTVVPEPPSVVALCGLAMMGGLMWVVRRVRGLRGE